MNVITNATRVKDWMARVDQPTPEQFTPFEQKALELRRNLITEEFDELMWEFNAPLTLIDYTKITKEATDLLVTVYGMFTDLGIDADMVFKIVQAGNELKTNFRETRADGKIIVPASIKHQIKDAVHEALSAYLETLNAELPAISTKATTERQSPRNVPGDS